MQGTANLVEIAKRAGVKRIVLVSSIGADEPFFPLNLLFGVKTPPCLPFWQRHPVPLVSGGLAMLIVAALHTALCYNALDPATIPPDASMAKPDADVVCRLAALMAGLSCRCCSGRRGVRKRCSAAGSPTPSCGRAACSMRPGRGRQLPASSWRARAPSACHPSARLAAS